LRELPVFDETLGMGDIRMYHEGSRQLQDQFGSRQLADRLVERLAHVVLSPDDIAFIQSCNMFFLATADADGFPDCSYKGGAPGFVRVIGESTLAFPSYDGNGMFKSLGNVVVNPHVGLLFIDFEKPRRLRVNGSASLDERDPLLPDFPGAQLIVRVEAQAIFPNCPRYIHKAQSSELSVYAPREGHEPPEPGWKSRPEFCDVLPQKPKP
jgi:predicted pyridoxine 5'-phosphate oxidase superfamily flavin-nucleotide-binding protein